MFFYRCGCAETTVFRCPPLHFRPGAGAFALGATCYYENRFELQGVKLDEECHDCSRGFCLLSRSPLPAPKDVLRERDVNLPTDSAPGPSAEAEVEAEVPMLVATAVEESARSF